jgi:flagellar motility protein MotE (MotC chaperone)
MKGNDRGAGRSLLVLVLIGVGFAIAWLGMVAGWAGETPTAKVPEAGATPPAQTGVPGESAVANSQTDKVQGPALDDVREILQVLNQRKEALAKREEALRDAEARIATLRAEAEKILDRYETAVKKTAQAQVDARKASVAQAVKMFESMPPEEAATRLEKMPEKTAMELLRELKPKTAGAILAVVKPDRAAKLTEKFFGPVAREFSRPN